MPIYKNSRYTTSEIGHDGEKEYIKMRERLRFNEDDLIYHLYREGETLGLLAKRYYRDSQLWWVIMDSNPEYKFEFEIPYGTEIAIPTLKAVRRKLNG